MMNKSFSDLRGKLYNKGVKDLSFLEPKNKNLCGIDMIDPHSNDLTGFEKEEIKAEARKNLWYFLEYCVRIPNHEDKLSPFNINLTTFESLYALEKGASVYDMTPRQMANTTAHCAYILWNLYKDISTIFFIMSNSKTNDEYVFEKIYQINRCLPDYMRLNYSDIIDRYKEAFWFMNSIPEYGDDETSVINNDYRLKAGLKGRNVLFLIEHYECFSKSLIDKIEKRLIYLKSIDIDNIQTMYVNSCLGMEKSYGRFRGDLYRTTLRHFDIETVIVNDGITKSDFLYVQNDFSELVHDPEKWKDEMKRIFQNDQVAIKREIEQRM